MIVASHARPTGVTIDTRHPAHYRRADCGGQRSSGIIVRVAIGGLIAAFFGIIAIIEFVIAAGLLSGKSWRRKAEIAFSRINIILERFTLVARSILSVIFIILDIIVLHYMWRAQGNISKEHRTVG